MDVQCPRFLRNRVFTAACIALTATAAFAQANKHPQYTNKLAPYVSSPQPIVDRMLQMANPKPTDVVYDLGCGDGRVLITAAQRFNSQAVGIELDDKLVQRATDSIARLNLQSRVRVLQGDLLRADVSGADVVILYLMTASNEQLRPRLEQMLKPGARVVSYSYMIPGWKPVKVDKTDERHGHAIYMYEMPPAKQ